LDNRISCRHWAEVFADFICSVWWSVCDAMLHRFCTTSCRTSQSWRVRCTWDSITSATSSSPSTPRLTSSSTACFDASFSASCVSFCPERPAAALARQWRHLARLWRYLETWWHGAARDLRHSWRQRAVVTSPRYRRHTPLRRRR